MVGVSLNFLPSLKDGVSREETDERQITPPT